MGHGRFDHRDDIDARIIPGGEDSAVTGIYLLPITENLFGGQTRRFPKSKTHDEHDRRGRNQVSARRVE
jgi:hypothetical protein